MSVAAGGRAPPTARGRPAPRLDLIHVGGGPEAGLGQLAVVALEADEVLLVVLAAAARWRGGVGAVFAPLELVELHAGRRVLDPEEHDLLLDFEERNLD